MSRLSTISALVPSHQHYEFLPERLASILSQTCPPVELLVIDDGSTDGSAEWWAARQNQWTSAIRFELTFRAVASGNPFLVWRDLATRAQGDYLWIAESDDRCDPRLLETLQAAALRHPEASLIFAQSTLIDDDGRTAGTFATFTDALGTEPWIHDFCEPGTTAIASRLLARNTIPNVSGCLIRRSAWQGLISSGFAGPALGLAGDWLVYAHLLRSGSLVFVREPLNHHRHHAATQRARIDAARTIAEGYLVRSIITHFCLPTASQLELARRFAFDEALALLRCPPGQLAEQLSQTVLEAARAFDPRFDSRAERAALHTWDRCDLYFGAQGTFSEATKRSHALVAGTRHALTFRRVRGHLRLDPLARPGRAVLHRLDVRASDTNRMLQSFSSASGFGGIEVAAGAKISPSPEGLVVIATDSDPQLRLSGIDHPEQLLDVQIELTVAP